MEGLTIILRYYSEVLLEDAINDWEINGGQEMVYEIGEQYATLKFENPLQLFEFGKYYGQQQVKYSIQSFE